MSVSHGYSTTGGVEYDDRGYVEKTKKEKIVSHQLGVSMGYGDINESEKGLPCNGCTRAINV